MPRKGEKNKKRAAKKKKAASRPRLQDVAFNFAAGEERTEPVHVKDNATGRTLYKPFDITFTVPDCSERTGHGISMVQGESDDAKEARGKEMLAFIARHLKSWTLEPPCNAKSLAALNDERVFLKIYDILHESAARVKN